MSEFPMEIAYGTRYGDDSGWERRIEIDRHSNRVRIEISGDHITCDIDELKWLVDTAVIALKTAGEMTRCEVCDE